MSATFEGMLRPEHLDRPPPSFSDILHQTLRYPANVEVLPKEIGLLVQAIREAQGYNSARVLANAAGVHERSIQRIEAGERFGAKTVRAIERTLDLPYGTIQKAAETGDLSFLQKKAAKSPTISAPSALEEIELHYYRLKERRGQDTANRFLAQAVEVMKNAEDTDLDLRRSS